MTSDKTGSASLPPIEFGDLALRLRDRLQARVDRLGYLGGFFKYMGHQPDALIAFDVFTEECKRALPVEFAEAVALTVSTLLGNRYEQVQHERFAVSRGLAIEWVRDVERVEPDRDDSCLDESVRRVQRFVVHAIKSNGYGSGSGIYLDEIARVSGPAMAAAVALMTARFLGHAVISNALCLEPPVASIFDQDAS